MYVAKNILPPSFKTNNNMQLETSNEAENLKK
jgi:hypothetical protein